VLEPSETVSSETGRNSKRGVTWPRFGLVVSDRRRPSDWGSLARSVPPVAWTHGRWVQPCPARRVSWNTKREEHPRKGGAAGSKTEENVARDGRAGGNPHTPRPECIATTVSGVTQETRTTGRGVDTRITGQRTDEPRTVPLHGRHVTDISKLLSLPRVLLALPAKRSSSAFKTRRRTMAAFVRPLVNRCSSRPALLSRILPCQRLNPWIPPVRHLVNRCFVWIPPSPLSRFSLWTRGVWGDDSCSFRAHPRHTTTLRRFRSRTVHEVDAGPSGRSEIRRHSTMPSQLRRLNEGTPS
jgi:hypothetical protein